MSGAYSSVDAADQNIDLRWLISPISPERFFEAHWERSPLVINRSDARYYAALRTVEELDDRLGATQLKHPQVSLVAAAEPTNPNEYTYPSGLVDAARLCDHLSRGSTIVVQSMESISSNHALLCRSLEAELSIRFQTNAYVTPPNAQGLGIHYDSHDVFVIQVRGSKTWRLYDTPVETPYRAQEFKPDQVKVGPVSKEFTLRAGDLAYVPRGLLHEAVATTEPSVHVTLGVLHSSWTDFLAEALSLAGMRDAELRRALPIGFARPEFDRTAARAEFKRLLEKLLQAADFDTTMEHFIDDLVSTRHPIIPRQLDTVLRGLDRVQPATEIRARRALLAKCCDHAERFVVAAYGKEIAFPKAVAPAVRRALEGSPVRVNDLPALSPDDAVTLARRLVREGLVELSE